MLHNSRPVIFQLFSVYGQVGKVVVKVVESTQCRRRGMVTATNVVYIRCCRHPTYNQVTTRLWSWRRYCITTHCRRLRPVAEFTAPTTSHHRRPVTDFEAQSTRRHLHPVADLPASTVCRRLRDISDAMVCSRHVATQWSISYRVDTCLLLTTTILCRHRELAMPLGYASYF